MPGPAVPDTLSGGCLCGAVRYTYRGVLGGAHGAITLCQCQHCRRAQGFAVAVAPIAQAGLALSEQSPGALREYESSPGKFRAFCGQCGSPMYSRRAGLPDRLRLRLGSLDAVPLGLRIEARIYQHDLPEWVASAAAAPAYDGPEPARGPQSAPPA